MRVKRQQLIYETSQLEKDLLAQEVFIIPDNEFSWIWEKEELLEGGHMATIAYLEGGPRLEDGYTVVILKPWNAEDGIVYGWAGGWRLPVPERGKLRDIPSERIQEVVEALEWAERGELPHTASLPGFFVEDGGVFHSDGNWWAYVPYALPRQLPYFMDGEAWAIKEGIYISFPDGSYRLIPYSHWEKFIGVVDGYEVELVARQGDLLVFSYEYPPLMAEDPCFRPFDDMGERLDHHKMKVDGQAECQWLNRAGGVIVRAMEGDGVTLTITHPEHEEIKVEVPKRGYWVTLLPGTSHPFQNKID